MERTVKNYVLDAARAYYSKSDKNSEALRYYNDAVERFSMIHILNGMAHSETLKAIDMIDDKKMRRFLVKKYLKRYEERYEQYEHFMKTHMEHSAWVLLQDYVRVCWTKIEPRAIMLRLACQDYLNKNNVANAEILAQCEASLLLWQVACDTFFLYFKTYRNLCGIDFTHDFKYAEMHVCHDSWLMLTEELAKGLKGIDFGKDKRCVDCWNAMKNTLDNHEFFNDGAIRALTLNKDLLEKHKDEIEEIRKETATA